MAELVKKMEVRGKTVEVTMVGKSGMAASITAIGAAVLEARRISGTAILFDVREAITGDYRSHAVNIAEIVMRTLPIWRYRIAVVGNAGDPLLQFVETVGANRNIRVASFTDLEAARKWLDQREANEPRS